MKKILLVDDDEVIAAIYVRGFTKAGFAVERARDGLEAMKLLAETKPDVVVLDLMMPKFNGVDVLKFIRSREALKATPVIIMSNTYMSNVTQAAAVAGADKALLKARCTPSMLIEMANHLMSGGKIQEDVSLRLAAADVVPTLAAATSAPPAVAPAPPAPAPVPPATEARRAEEPAAAQTKLRQEFLEKAPATLKSVMDVYQAFAGSADPKARPLRLADLYRKIHFLTSMAGLAGCGQIGRFAAALEALLFELQEKPQHLTPSALHTISRSMELLARLFQQAGLSPAAELAPFNVLVVDDDAISNRLAVSALRRANLTATSSEDPLRALAMLKEKTYDLILLDISMPDMDGFTLCEKLRAVPGYQKTPVIFVTGQDDFESRTHSIRSGGDDLISKPIFPIELAVKAVTQLLGGVMGGT
jgi:CheY-like chemotaxis protein